MKKSAWIDCFIAWSAAMAAGVLLSPILLIAVIEISDGAPPRSAALFAVIAAAPAAATVAILQWGFRTGRFASLLWGALVGCLAMVLIGSAAWLAISPGDRAVYLSSPDQFRSFLVFPVFMAAFCIAPGLIAARILRSAARKARAAPSEIER